VPDIATIAGQATGTDGEQKLENNQTVPGAATDK
jgi:hypothetical protein